MSTVLIPKNRIELISLVYNTYLIKLQEIDKIKCSYTLTVSTLTKIASKEAYNCDTC